MVFWGSEMNARSRWILLVVLLLLGCASSGGSQAGSVAGIVLDDFTGAPLGNESVELIRCDKEVQLPRGERWGWQGAEAVPTDQAGEFLAQGLSPGLYLARGSNASYWCIAPRFEVRSGRTATIVIRMQRREVGVFQNGVFKGIRR